MNTIPPPLEERLSTSLKCSEYFEKFYKCRGSGAQISNVYEFGTVKQCTEQWEEYKWCLRSKFLKDEQALQRLMMRKRNVYFGIDQLPWTYRRAYLQYLNDQRRLPKHLQYLVQDED